MWACPKCQSKVDDSSEICWSCGTSSRGEEDPTFAHADEVGPIDDPASGGKPVVRDELTDEFAGTAEDNLVECYWAKNHIEARFLADQLGQEGIPAVADFHDLRVVFAGCCGLVPAGPYFGPRVRVGARDLTRARAWLDGHERRPRGK